MSFSKDGRVSSGLELSSRACRQIRAERQNALQITYTEADILLLVPPANLALDHLIITVVIVIIYGEVCWESGDLFPSAVWSSHGNRFCHAFLGRLQTAAVAAATA